MKIEQRYHMKITITGMTNDRVLKIRIVREEHRQVMEKVREPIGWDDDIINERRSLSLG